MIVFFDDVLWFYFTDVIKGAIFYRSRRNQVKDFTIFCSSKSCKFNSPTAISDNNKSDCVAGTKSANKSRCHPTRNNADDGTNRNREHSLRRCSGHQQLINVSRTEHAQYPQQQHQFQQQPYCNHPLRHQRRSSSRWYVSTVVRPNSLWPVASF